MNDKQAKPPKPLLLMPFDALMSDIFGDDMPKPKKKPRKTHVARTSLQVRKDLEWCTHATRVTWTHKLNRARAMARKDGHRLDVWSARHKAEKGRPQPQYFLAVCKRCRGVFIVEKSKRETYWLFPYGTCRAVPRKVIMIGGQIMVSGTAVKVGFKRKFV